MRDREKMTAFAIDAVIGRLFTDGDFLRVARKNPESIALAYNLGPREAEGFKDIVSKFDKIGAVDLAKGTVASGYGCTSGGDD